MSPLFVTAGPGRMDLVCVAVVEVEGALGAALGAGSSSATNLLYHLQFLRPHFFLKREAQTSRMEGAPCYQRCSPPGCPGALFLATTVIFSFQHTDGTFCVKPLKQKQVVSL